MRPHNLNNQGRAQIKGAMGKTYRVECFRKVMYNSVVDQLRRAHLSYQRLTNFTLKNAFGFKMLH